MCGTYVIVTKIKTLEKKFRVQAVPELDFETNSAVGIGDKGLVITSEDPDQLQSFRFGLTPYWAKKPMYLFNARSETILSKPSFKKLVPQQRCLIPADCYMEGTLKEKTKKPYLVYLNDKTRPFAFAGIYDQWTDTRTGEIINSYSIITTAANQVLEKLPHDRMPVILDEGDYQKYLDPSRPINEITSLLKPFNENRMNAYPISQEYKKQRHNITDVIQPIGQRVIKEYDIILEKKEGLQGMGMTSARERRIEMEDSDFEEE